MSFGVLQDEPYFPLFSEATQKNPPIHFQKHYMRWAERIHDLSESASLLTFRPNHVNSRLRDRTSCTSRQKCLSQNQDQKWKKGNTLFTHRSLHWADTGHCCSMGLLKTDAVVAFQFRPSPKNTLTNPYGFELLKGGSLLGITIKAATETPSTIVPFMRFEILLSFFLLSSCSIVFTSSSSIKIVIGISNFVVHQQRRCPGASLVKTWHHIWKLRVEHHVHNSWNAVCNDPRLVSKLQRRVVAPLLPRFRRIIQRLHRHNRRTPNNAVPRGRNRQRPISQLSQNKRRTQSSPIVHPSGIHDSSRGVRWANWISLTSTDWRVVFQKHAGRKCCTVILPRFLS